MSYCGRSIRPSVFSHAPSGCGDEQTQARAIAGRPPRDVDASSCTRGLQRLGHTTPAVRHRLHVGMRQPLDRSVSPAESRPVGSGPRALDPAAMQSLHAGSRGRRACGDRQKRRSTRPSVGRTTHREAAFVEPAQARLACAADGTYDEVRLICASRSRRDAGTRRALMHRTGSVKPR